MSYVWYSTGIIINQFVPRTVIVLAGCAGDSRSLRCVFMSDQIESTTEGISPDARYAAA